MKKKNVAIDNLESVLPEDADKIQQILTRLGDDVVRCHVNKGPAVVRMALSLRQGVRYSQLVENANGALTDLSIHPSRIEAPIMGHDLVGIEFPRCDPETVQFPNIYGKNGNIRRVVVERAMQLPVAFGKDLNAAVVTCDLASAPHMLIGGAPEQGARQFLHNVICGLVETCSPEEVQFILIDPRCVEFAPYAKLNNLVVPVINDIRRVVFALHWAVAEMDKRLKMFAKARVRNIAEFNSRDPNAPATDMFGDVAPPADLPAALPYIVIVINDLDEVMGKSGKEVQSDIQRLTAKARAAGIHLVMATECIDKKVLPNELTANIPVRVAFRMMSAKDSELILGDAGAESLIGGGDALVQDKSGVVSRVQAPAISEAEVNALVASSENAAASKAARAAMMRKDYRKAYEVVVETQVASTSHLQRHLGWGYNHAAALIDELEANGVIGPQRGACPRKVLVDKLPEPYMAEVEMKMRLPLEELDALRRIAEERHCNIDGIVSEFVSEGLAKTV